MPQNLTGLSAVAGFARGFGPQFAASRRQNLEQERKGQKESLQNLAGAIRAYKEYSELEPGNPLRPLLEEQMRGMIGYVPGEQKQQGMGKIPFPALGQDRPIRTPEVREAFIGAGAERATALAGAGEERVSQITIAKREEKATLRKRAEQLMKQRRDFLRGDPIMTALGGLIQPTWSDETEGVELNNILSDLRTKHRFNYPKSFMDALKLTGEKFGPPKPTAKEDSLGLFKQ